MGTLSVWAGEDHKWMDGATQVPVTHSVSFHLTVRRKLAILYKLGALNEPR